MITSALAQEQSAAKKKQAEDKAKEKAKKRVKNW